MGSNKPYRTTRPGWSDWHIPMATKYLPVDRRDLTLINVNHCVANYFAICVRLSLFKGDTVGDTGLNNFARRLFRIVQKRHTHLWDKN